MRSIFTACLTSLILAFPYSGQALAHAHLKSATPAENATLISGPKIVTLTFSEGLELKFSSLKITGPDKAAVSLGVASHGAGGDAALEVPVTGPLGPGVYKVEWNILSKDGHKTKGSYTFTLKP